MKRSAQKVQGSLSEPSTLGWGRTNTMIARTSARIAPTLAIIAFGVLAGSRAERAAAAPNDPFLFSYTFSNRLALGGGNYTMNGPVLVVVRLNNGRTMFSQNLLAKPHSVTPGGAVYVHTNIPQPCSTNNNAYARALDRTTGRWSPRIPVGYCQGL
jgi:hypothetical protein